MLQTRSNPSAFGLVIILVPIIVVIAAGASQPSPQQTTTPSVQYGFGSCWGADGCYMSCSRAWQIYGMDGLGDCMGAGGGGGRIENL